MVSKRIPLFLTWTLCILLVSTTLSVRLFGDGSSRKGVAGSQSESSAWRKKGWSSFFVGAAKTTDNDETTRLDEKEQQKSRQTSDSLDGVGGSGWLQDGYSQNDIIQDSIIENDNDLDNEEGRAPPQMQSQPLLQIPLSLQTEEGDNVAVAEPINAFIDTGAQVSILSVRAARQAGVLHLLDRRYAGHAQGVGQCRVLGRLPAGVVHLRFGTNSNGRPIIVPSPAITILERTNTGFDLLLGLDFLREYGAILNLRQDEMILSIGGEDVMVPFIRPRGLLFLSEEEGEDSLLQGATTKVSSNGCDASSVARQCSEESYSTNDQDDEEDEDDGPIDMSGV